VAPISSNSNNNTKPNYEIKTNENRTNENKTEANFKKTITDREQDEEIIKEFLITKHKTCLLFSNFKILQNEEYHNFKINNDERWGILTYLIEHLQKLFKKLNLPICE